MCLLSKRLQKASTYSSSTLTILLQLAIILPRTIKLLKSLYLGIVEPIYDIYAATAQDLLDEDTNKRPRTLPSIIVQYELHIESLGPFDSTIYSDEQLVARLTAVVSHF